MSLSLKRITKLVTRLRPASQHDLASSLCRYEDGTVQAGDRPAPGGLPVELILQVISHLDRTELLVLCVTSKQFYAAVYPRLYTTIYLKHGTVCHKTETNQAPIQFIWLGSAQFCDIIQTSKQQVLVDQQQLQLLCRSLQIKHISNTVTEFRFEFRSCGGAIKSRWGFKPSPIPPCLCDKMDSLLGQALTSLVNLQVLHLNCMCCINRPTKKSTRHAFLGTLPKNRLQSLWLRCWCVPSDILGQLLATPGVQGVTVLRWESYSVRPVQSILASDRLDLPDLSKLMCNDVALFSPLISRGTLTHLICDADDKDLHNLISRNHGHLVHLRVPILQDILIGMQRHQAPYRNISHLGCVQFLMSNLAEMFAAMKVLASLPRLVSIEITKLFRYHDAYDESDPYVNPSHDKLIKEIGQQLSKLQKIYCLTSLSFGCCGRERRYWIWTREEDQWRGREVDFFTSWDIIHNRC